MKVGFEPLMHSHLRVFALAGIGVLTLATTLGATPKAAGASDAATSDDLRQSFHLLATTYYSKVDAQTLLDGARAALEVAAQKKGFNLALPTFRDDGAAPKDVAQIAQAIASLQDKTHQSSEALTYAAIDGMARSLGDRWTEFFTPDKFREFNEDLDPSKISGIGVMIQPDPATKYIRAEYVVPQTPADAAGLRSGDLLVSVNGKPTRGLASADASRLLRGAPGTQVVLRVQRNGTLLPPFEITRSEVQPPTVIFRMLPDGIGYIWITAFGETTPGEFDVALKRLAAQNVRGYVLDLRNDGGGYVSSALEISSKFVKDDPLVTIEERGKKPETVDAWDDAVPSKPMAILVNGYTASASEITAGALQDDGVAQLVGEKTYGKGVMQSLTALPDGAAIKITTAHYLTPKHRDINLKGIEPDVIVNEPDDALFGDLSADPQMRAAFDLVKGKLPPERTTPVSS